MRRQVHVPLYAVLVLVLAALSGPPLSIYASVRIANNNSEQLIERYRADQAVQAEKVAKEKAAAAEENRRIYCTVFSTQLDALESATTPAGMASYRAWLDLYQLAHCQPPRK